MTKDDVIRMAQELGVIRMDEDANEFILLEYLPEIAELVRKDYSTKHANIWLDRIHKAVAEEREECAKVCEDAVVQRQFHSNFVCASSIRARGETK